MSLSMAGCEPSSAAASMARDKRGRWAVSICTPWMSPKMPPEIGTVELVPDDEAVDAEPDELVDPVPAVEPAAVATVADWACVTEPPLVDAELPLVPDELPAGG